MKNRGKESKPKKEAKRERKPKLAKERVKDLDADPGKAADVRGGPFRSGGQC